MMLMLAAASMAVTAGAQTEAMRAGAIPIESMDDFVRWVQQKPAPQGVFPRVKVATTGKKVYFPIVVSGLRPPEHGEIRLVGDFEILAPDGKAIVSAKQCCKFTITDHPEFRSAVLGPVFDLTFDPGDPKGSYTVRVSVTDGTRTVTGTEHFQYGSASASAPAVQVKDATPGASPAADAPPRRTFSHKDRTQCLDRPTNREIILCAEGAG
ncbi:MAG: hypothetical protein ABI789_00155 [Usitatibacter sp.]